MIEEIVQYLSERRDYYQRLQEKEERKTDYNPALRIEYISKKKLLKKLCFTL